MWGYHILSCCVLFLGLFYPVSCQPAPPPPTPSINLLKVLKPVKKCSLKDIHARCDMVANPNKPSDINGTLFFTQTVNPDDCRYGRLYIQVNINNVPIHDGTMRHGLHVHQYGHISEGCESCGPHYNPYNVRHGSLWDLPRHRHLGDLGNVEERSLGTINQLIVDYFGSLSGRHSIAGRGVVLHAAEDDGGKNTTSPESGLTGNAGARLACCAIKYAPKPVKLAWTYK